MPDSLGRVRIPKELWKCIDVDLDDEDAKQIVVTGCGKYGEIWRKSNYEAHRNSRRTAESRGSARGQDPPRVSITASKKPVKQAHLPSGARFFVIYGFTKNVAAEAQSKKSKLTFCPS